MVEECLVVRMLFEEVGGGIKALLGFCGHADFFDFGGGDDGGFVAEGVSDVGEDGGDFLVGELFEGGHGDLAGVLFSFDFDGAKQAVESDFDEAFFAALDPLGSGQWREHGGGEAFAIGLVAGDAVAFAAVNFMAFLEEGEGFAFEGAGGVRDFFGGVTIDFLTCEVGGGGFEDRFEPGVDGVLGDFCSNGEAFIGREPGGCDGSFESDAGGFVCCGLLEESRRICDLVAVVADDLNSGGPDAWVSGDEE